MGWGSLWGGSRYGMGSLWGRGLYGDRVLYGAGIPRGWGLLWGRGPYGAGSLWSRVAMGQGSLWGRAAMGQTHLVGGVQQLLGFGPAGQVGLLHFEEQRRHCGEGATLRAQSPAPPPQNMAPMTPGPQIVTP